MGDTIDPNGWDLTAYNANPVILWSHDSSAPPIGRMIRTWVEAGRLMGDVEFADAETYAFADDIFKLVQAGFIKAGSVGFLPIDYVYSDDEQRPYGIDFTRQELLEFSITPVPANANALTQARAKGLSTGPLQGRIARATTRQEARLRQWVREANDPEAEDRLQRALALQRGLSRPMRPDHVRTEGEMVAHARGLALREIHAAADLTTTAGRTAHARRLQRHHAAEGGAPVVSHALVVAEALWRTVRRW